MRNLYDRVTEALDKEETRSAGALPDPIRDYLRALPSSWERRISTPLGLFLQDIAVKYASRSIAKVINLDQRTDSKGVLRKAHGADLLMEFYRTPFPIRRKKKEICSIKSSRNSQNGSGRPAADKALIKTAKNEDAFACMAFVIPDPNNDWRAKPKGKIHYLHGREFWEHLGIDWEMIEIEIFYEFDRIAKDYGLPRPNPNAFGL